ncbi:hypothetical protein B0H14DRAFT_2650630 [Mycena olivaceomarginata]|nr:hypothetical protein B0H14DRAFT_2650630 [Mycena olivaceomarginata]
MYSPANYPEPPPNDLDALNLKQVFQHILAAVIPKWANISVIAADITTNVIATEYDYHADDDLTDQLSPRAAATYCKELANHIPPHRALPPRIRLDATQADSAIFQHTKYHGPGEHPNAIRTPNFSVLEQRVAATGWIGIRGDSVAAAEVEVGLAAEVTWCPTRVLADFFGPQATMHGFRLENETHPVVDSDGRVYAVFAGHEANPNFKAELWRRHSASAQPRTQKTLTRRGTFYQEYTGQSHGGGQFVPGTLQRGSVKAVLMLWLLSQAVFIRLAGFGFATGVFAGFAPDLYEYYAINMRAFYAKNPRSRCPFLNSIWSACTFNLGPQIGSDQATLLSSHDQHVLRSAF